MVILRNILAIVVGYAIFVISAVLLFKISGVDPHADASSGFIVLVIFYGLFFSFTGGIATQLISRSGALIINWILAGIIAGFAAFSLLKTSGQHYSQFAGIFLFAPASILAGIVYLRKFKSTHLK